MTSSSREWFATGQPRHRVRAGVLRDVLWLGRAGTMAGLSLAWAASRALRGFLVGASGIDLPTCAAVAGIFLATSVAAALVPAIRASRVDPLIAMRDGG